MKEIGQVKEDITRFKSKMSKLAHEINKIELDLVRYLRSSKATSTNKGDL